MANREFKFRRDYNEHVASADVGIIMGSTSDFPTMVHACDALEELHISYEVSVISAHRTPDRMMDYATRAEKRGLKVIIAGAGGAAHLPGMVSGSTILPVLGVPVQSKALNGLDSLLSIAQMPKGVPTPTMSIGDSGAFNAGLSAARILALGDSNLRMRLKDYVHTLAVNVPLAPNFTEF